MVTFSRLILAEKRVDQVGDILDGHHAITIHIDVVGQFLTAEHLVNQVGHIIDCNMAIAIDIARPGTQERHDARKPAPDFMSTIIF